MESPRTYSPAAGDDVTSLTSFHPFSEEDESDYHSYALVTSLFSRIKNSFAMPLTSATPVVPSFGAELDSSSSRSGQYTPVYETQDGGLFGTAIPGFPVQDDTLSIRTSASLNRSASVSKVIRRIRLEGLSRDHWVEDSYISECYDCNSVFTTWRRKHHCRICGQIFCSRCASSIIDGSRFGHDGMVRMCNFCLEKVTTFEDEGDDYRRSVVSSTASPFTAHQFGGDSSALSPDHHPQASFAASQLFGRTDEPLNPYSIAETKRPVSDSNTVPVYNDQLGDSPPEAMLQDLTRYIIKDEDYPVARGGFGEVWRCTYQQDRSPIKVAVKSLQVYAADHLGVAKTKKIKRIERELRICASLKHTNILPVYGYTSGFGPFIAIVGPWAENGNLTAYLERHGETLTLARRFQILRDIIAGLQYLHVNNVIHGDFNGPNVLIHGDGTACIADFGLSLMYSEVMSVSQASWTSTIKGNLRWMAPELLVEQEDGRQVRPSKQSDIYSFGGIMLQVLTNKIPYYHFSNDAAIILCIAKSEMPSRSRYPAQPDKYWHFIEQCWSADPQDRPSTNRVNEVIRNEFYLFGSRHEDTTAW
ncbi:kinase-like domain-containing protein [Suillus ampliporus]|nr:kinase-like domain-containing protein [Suillus ampliporus]